MSVNISDLITAGVGTVALVVYAWQKRDKKILAANAILFEIKNAERSIKNARDNLKQNTLSEELFTMQVESWSKYRHLFVKDFDRDEWDNITDFYNKCQLFDEAVKYNKTFFQKNEEQIRVNKQRIIADYAKEAVDAVMQMNPSDPQHTTMVQKVAEDFTERTKRFDDTYMNRQDLVMYSPLKPVNDARIYLEDLKPISNTNIGTRLKKIARIKP